MIKEISDGVTRYGLTNKEISYLATGFAAFIGAVIGVIVVTWIMS